MAHVLIVDDDAAFCDALAETVASLGHDATTAAGGVLALCEMKRRRFDAVFLDHRMAEMDGLQTLAAMRERLAPLPPVIVLTAHAGSASTIEAMRLGAFDHLSKPIGRDAVRDVLARALRHGGDSRAIALNPSQDALAGNSAAMREVHKRIGLAAASDVPVLVLGETGTGKEMAARALHRHSKRAALPFVAVNCAAMPSDLLESELFGHVRGAFTGATADRVGCFRAADGGVLLLDEIGDMTPAVQAKILRVLEVREVTPLGSHRAVKVDVRVIAATHRDLPTGVRDGTFREDLMYRLDVLPIVMPPLRERLADLPLLAEHFLQRAAWPEAPKSLSDAAVRRLLEHTWPGNVRELKNVMERCHALVRHGVVDAHDIDWGGRGKQANDGGVLPAAWLDSTLPEATENLERFLIAHALAACNGNRAEAARKLGIHRQLLYKKIAQYQL